jgi:hypothetical protein
LYAVAQAVKRVAAGRDPRGIHDVAGARGVAGSAYLAFAGAVPRYAREFDERGLVGLCTGSDGRT